MPTQTRAKMETKRFRMQSCKYDSEKGTFEGHGAVFGNVDSDDDIIEPGAFSKFLAGDWSRVKILVLHNDEWLPIGKPLEMYEDDVGLYIVAKISDTSMGKDVLTLLRDDVLNELSIGYITHDSYSDAQHIRHLTELELLEVSVVTWAANDQAKILDVKSLVKAAGNPAELLALAETLEKAAAAISAQAENPAEAQAGSKAAPPLTYTLRAELKSVPDRHRRRKRADRLKP